MNQNSENHLDDHMLHLLDNMESDLQLQEIKGRIAIIETQMKNSLSEETWNLLLEWESLWAEYAHVGMKYMYDKARVQRG